jgi:flagellar biosynthesis protein FlhG
MNDQAEKLRNIVKNLKENNNSEVNAESKKAARVIAVTSGKGGVGKTNITVNLGIALSKRGLRVVILDVDLGLANIDILLGKSTRYTLVELIRGERNIFEVLADGPDNVKFISGGSGVDELAQLDKSQIDNLVSNIALLDKLCDVILIDTGAGISNSVISFLMTADDEKYKPLFMSEYKILHEALQKKGFNLFELSILPRKEKLDIFNAEQTADLLMTGQKARIDIKV